MTGRLRALYAPSMDTASEDAIAATTTKVRAKKEDIVHGIGGFAAGGTLMAQNLSTDARPWVGLNFCEGQCSFTDLNAQTTQAIQQVRSIVANDTRFQNGYSFVAHSQGSAVARAVIEEMDDHKVHTFISLAGAANGIFYGPQPSDFLPSVFFLQAYAPLVIDPRLLNISTYSVADIPTGRLTIDTIKLQMAYPQLQSAASAYQSTARRSRAPGSSTTSFWP